MSDEPVKPEPVEPVTIVDTRPRIPGPRGGWIIPGGKPGNRGGRGRPHRRIIIRAGQNLERELARLEAMAKAAHDVTCPSCGKTFTPRPTAKMDTRDRIAYARLCADIKASGKGDEEPPLEIVVLSAGTDEIIARAGPPPDGVVFVDADADAERPDAEPSARNPALGPPGFLKSGSSGG